MVTLPGKIPSGPVEAQKNNGDVSSYMTALYQKYKALLFQKAGSYARGDIYAQEDIVQDALLRLLRNVDRLQTLEPPALVSYISLTVRSAALNYFHAEHSDRLDSLPLPEENDLDREILLSSGTPRTIEDQLLLGHRNEKVRAAVKQLSERDQLVLIGKYFLELDTQELTELLGTTPGGLRVQLHRARQRALKALIKEGILHE